MSLKVIMKKELAHVLLMKYAVSNNTKNDFHKWYFVFLDGRTIKRTACMYCGMINSLLT